MASGDRVVHPVAPKYGGCHRQRAAVVEGRWELMGGTGKYAGVTGTCTYETSYLSLDRVVTEADCTWERR